MQAIIHVRVLYIVTFVDELVVIAVVPIRWFMSVYDFFSETFTQATSTCKKINNYKTTASESPQKTTCIRVQIRQTVKITVGARARYISAQNHAFLISRKQCS